MKNKCNLQLKQKNSNLGYVEKRKKIYIFKIMELLQNLKTVNKTSKKVPFYLIKYLKNQL